MSLDNSRAQRSQKLLLFAKSTRNFKRFGHGKKESMLPKSSVLRGSSYLVMMMNN